MAIAECIRYLLAMKQKFGRQHSLRTFKMPAVFKLHRYSPFSLPLPTFSHRVISVVASLSHVLWSYRAPVNWLIHFQASLFSRFGAWRAILIFQLIFLPIYVSPHFLWNPEITSPGCPSFCLGPSFCYLSLRTSYFFPSVSQAMLLNCTLTVKLRFIHLHLISFSTLRPLLSLYQVIATFRLQYEDDYEHEF